MIPVTGSEAIEMYERFERRLALRKAAREAGLTVSVPAGRGAYDKRRDPLRGEG